ncbi:MAG: pirin family protein [Myxococcales bacterium]|nr:pirin family protein [Myxococcales bacterium]
MDRRTLLGALAVTPLVAACEPLAPRVAAPPEARPEPAEAPLVQAEPLETPWQTIDPFLFCFHHHDAFPQGNAQMGPAASLAGRTIGSDFSNRDGWSMYHGDVVPGFPQHPHRGFETVTVVRRGRVDHSDSLGATARYGDGDVQWLTAGHGIVHAEMMPLLAQDGPNPLDLFQIWLNLPAADKHADPHFKMLWAEHIPRPTLRDAAGRQVELALVAGQLAGARPPAPPPRSWAARPENEVAIVTLKLAPGARYTLPPASRGVSRMLYFYRGSRLRVGPAEVEVGRALTLRGHVAAALENGRDESELLLLQGRAIGEPVVKHGPFVMNTRQEIAQAFSDYRSTRFGGWPWPGDGPVHPRGQDRFARQADGRVERAPRAEG